jgi:hypothetical protein
VRVLALATPTGLRASVPNVDSIAPAACPGFLFHGIVAGTQPADCASMITMKLIMGDLTVGFGR